jgi:glycosyltransferase involved in cell wall biosynthesis
MTIYFYEPPPVQRVGGLDAAIASLERYLISQEVGVVRGHDAFASKTNVVHFHGLWQPAFLGVSRRCRAAGIPYIVSPHGMLEPWAWNQKRWKKWPYFFLFERGHLRRASSLLATSELEAGNLHRFFPRVPCAAIPLGLPEERHPDYERARKRLGWRSEEKILVFLSRIHPKKGLELLLQALAGIQRGSLRAARLVIIGEGEPAYVNALRDRIAASNGVLPRVDWLGPVWSEEKWLYLQGADLFCLPSFSENFGLAVLESLQVGTRVLTTNSGPWEFLRGWKAGFVVEPTALAVQDGLKEFLVSPDWPEAKRARLAAQARERFGWEKLGPEYLKLYRSVLTTR